MLEFFGRLFKIDTESDAIKQARAQELAKARQRIAALDYNSPSLYKDAVVLGKEMASEKGVDMSAYSEEIVGALKTAPVCEVAMILTAYIDGTDLKRMEYIPVNVIKSINSLIGREEHRGRFDIETQEDLVAITVLFEAVRKRLTEVRADDDESFRSNVYSGVENMAGSAGELRTLMVPILSDMMISTDFDEKVSSWRAMKWYCRLEECVGVVSSSLKENPVQTAMFIEKVIGIIDEKRSAYEYGIYQEITAELYSKKQEIVEAGLWDMVLRVFAKKLESGKIERTLLDEGLYREVSRYSEEQLVITEIEHASSFDEAMSLLSLSDREALETWIAEDEGELQSVLDAIFDTVDSNDLDTDFLVTARGKVRKQAKSYLLDPRVEKLFQTMAAEGNRSKFFMELAIYSSLVPFGELKRKTKEALKAQHLDSEQRLLALNGGWSLCSMSEHRILTDILSRDAILVNETMLLKFTGKKAALCLETHVDPSGDIFFEGVWYALIDPASKGVVKDAFKDGRVCVNGMEGKWAVMRSITEDREYDTMSARSLLTVARNYGGWCVAQGRRKGVVDRSRSSVKKMGEAY